MPHTPGPWAVRGERDSGTLSIVQASTGGLIATLEETFGYGEADEANAHLMAAAPTLLVAIQVMVLTPGILAHLAATDPMALEQARAAIAKAQQS